MQRRTTPGELAQAMGQLTPEQLKEIHQRADPFNRIIQAERAKAIPDHHALLAAYEGLDAINQDFNLPVMYDMGKIRANMYLAVSAPTTLQ